MRRSEEPDLALRWSNRLSLRHRILAVNAFPLAVLAGSLFYLDSFRTRLTEARIEQAKAEASLISRALAVAPEGALQPLLVRLGQDSRARLRVYGPGGGKRADSWRGAVPTYRLRHPESEPLRRRIAGALDEAFDFVVGADRPPLFIAPAVDRLRNWPEARAALARGEPVTQLRRAPDGTPYISAAAPVAGLPSSVLLLTANAREVRRIVRAERLTLGLVLLGAILLSWLLSRFLARTIAAPLRRLALAAHRVRLGRAREVDVPKLPARRDEIGLLARGLHDMTQALRRRIDATEAFAADVTHELRNPLASLRSAVDSLERVDDPELSRRLQEVIRQDVGRLDRLIGDIAEGARLDAELSRAQFEPVDLGALIEPLVPLWEGRGKNGMEIAFARPQSGTAVIAGDESRLARLVDNLVDNAVSFSPPGGLVTIAAAEVGDHVLLTVEDEGPGVPPELREAIFQRFNSIRPEAEFGRHSGLGLAIARAVVEAHDGTITVEDRSDGRPGARFCVRLPKAGQ